MNALRTRVLFGAICGLKYETFIELEYQPQLRFGYFDVVHTDYAFKLETTELIQN